MGFRNPFRFAVDRKSNSVYVGDYSPDANEADPLRGPQGIGRWMLIDRPGNYGWPYCMTRELGYVDYDFATGASGEEFPCPNPVNESPNNTGRRVLPEVVQPDVFYSYPDADFGLFPELLEDRGGDGIGPMGGPAYDFMPSSRSETKWPEVFDGHPLFYEWTRDYFKVFELNRENGNRLTDIHNLFPGGPSGIIQDNPMDAEFGPDGALYTLEYGDGFFLETPEAQLSRIDFVRQNQYTPIPQVSATPTSATAPPLTVQFSSAGTRDPDGDTLAYAWDFDADGDVDSREPNPSFIYTAARHLRRHAAGHRQLGPLGVRLRADHRRQPGAGGRPGGRVDDAAVRLRRHGALHRRGDRRPAGRLRARERGLHPRPRPARAPADLDRRL